MGTVPARSIPRRDLLKALGAASVPGLSSLLLNSCGGSGGGGSLTSGTGSCSTVSDIDYVVILIQENRSFDHYFGSYRGVRGFSDQSSAFRQPDPANSVTPPYSELLPFHLDTSTVNAACTHDIDHS